MFVIEQPGGRSQKRTYLLSVMAAEMGKQTLVWAAYERECWKACDRLADGTGHRRGLGGSLAGS